MIENNNEGLAEIAKNYLPSSDLTDIGYTNYDMSKLTMGEFWPMVKEVLEQPTVDPLGSAIRYKTLQDVVSTFNSEDKLLNKDQLEVYRMYQEEMLDFSKKMLTYSFVNGVHEMVYCSDFATYKKRLEHIEGLFNNDGISIDDYNIFKEDINVDRKNKLHNYIASNALDPYGSNDYASTTVNKTFGIIYGMCEDLSLVDDDKTKAIIDLFEDKMKPSGDSLPAVDLKFKDILVKDIFVVLETIYAEDNFPSRKGGDLIRAMCTDSAKFLKGKHNIHDFLENSINTEFNKISPFEKGLVFSYPGTAIYQGVELANYENDVVKYQIPNVNIAFQIDYRNKLSHFVHYDYKNLDVNDLWEKRRDLFESKTLPLHSALSYSAFERSLKVSVNNLGNIQSIFGKFQEENPEFMKKVGKFYTEGQPLDINVALNGVRDIKDKVIYMSSDHNSTHDLTNYFLNRANPNALLGQEIPDEVKYVTPTKVEYYPLDNAPSINMSLLGKKAQGLLELKNANYSIPESLVFPVTNSQLYQKDKAAWLKSLRPELNKISEKFKDSNGRPALCSIIQSNNEKTILNVGIDSTNYDYLCKEMGEKVVHECITNFMKTFCKSSFNEEVEFSSNLSKALFQFRSTLNRHGIGQDFDGLFPLNSRQQYRLSLDAMFTPKDSKIRQEDNTEGVIVQKMIYGNKNQLSGFGQFTSRSVESGKPGLSGLFTPVSQEKKHNSYTLVTDLQNTMPEVLSQLEKAAKQLEEKNQCIQKFDFIVEDGKLYFTRQENIKMNPLAQAYLNQDLYHRGVLDKEKFLNTFNIEALNGGGKRHAQLAGQILEHFGVSSAVDENIFKPTQESLLPKTNWLKQFSQVKELVTTMEDWELEKDESSLGLNNKIAIMLLMDYQLKHQPKQIKQSSSAPKLVMVKEKIGVMNKAQADLADKIKFNTPF